MAENTNMLYLCTGVPLDPTNTRQLYFSSPVEQLAYFAGKAVKSGSDYMYIRDTRSIKVPYNAEEIQDVNYLCFYNGGLGADTKWTYGYVTHIQYISPTVSRVDFIVDAWQTWGMLADIRECDISREHTDPGAAWNANTVPEGLDTGELECVHEEKYYIGSPEDDSFIMLSTIDLTADPGTQEEPIVNAAPGGVAAGMPSACAVYYISPGTSSLTDIFTAMRDYPWVAQGVVSITYCPATLVPDYSVVSSPMGFSIGVVQRTVADPVETDVNVTGYFPAVRNKKLWTSPYTKIELVLPDGSGRTYRPELFGKAPKLSSMGAVVPSLSMVFSILPYDGMEELQGNTVAYSGFPSFPVPQTGYAATVAQMNATYDLNRQQSKETRTFGLISGAIGALIGAGSAAASGGAAGAASSAASSIQQIGTQYFGSKLADQQAAERERMSIAQHTEGTGLSGASSGGDNVLYCHDRHYYAVRWFCLRPEWRERLDTYFDMFGYKVNRVGRPHIALRPRYNYIQCASVNIYGPIPSQFLTEIQSMFLRGVTFWKDTENVGVYGNNE